MGAAENDEGADWTAPGADGTDAAADEADESDEKADSMALGAEGTGTDEAFFIACSAQ